MFFTYSAHTNLASYFWDLYECKKCNSNQILDIISKEMTSNTEKLLSCQENNTKKIKSGNINTKHLKSLQNFSCS